ncbi:hypothetical protein QTG54_002792 [Skeletonema marinoi]|uniref:Uncharacterized protein n=1 Tax=Skeletonema marinoi TaxID=267567 RepID=A0AAD8YIN4_9STRA|nr:hypothetical protein QTG54_002792 [Skeletonema marinoi]
MSSDSSSSSSVASDDVSLEFTEDKFLNDLQRMWENDPTVTRLVADGSFACIQDMTDNGWEKFGRDVSNSNYLDDLQFSNCLDDHNMSFLFRGLTRSSSIRRLGLFYNGLGFSGVQSMVPFLQNASNLLELNINYNNIKSEGFNLLFRALRDSPINHLRACYCGLDSIEIDDA